MTLTAAPPSGDPTGFLGVVMLDTRFPRPPGDVGHPDAFGVPVRQRVVQGAWPGTIVQTAAGLRAAGVAPAFVHAVQALAAEGARAITTSCGFLVLLQDELQAAARVPVITSSLLQLPGLLARQSKVGVLTISAAALGPEHLLAAGVPANRLGDVVVQGVAPTGEFAAAILGNRDTMDLEWAGRDVVDAATALKQREPSLQALVLECTNMPPYRQALEAATGLKTWALADDETLLCLWR
jgi:hypothetical protein